MLSKKLTIKARETVRKRVYRVLRERILSGVIAPAQRLVETRIAREIGVSRTPVREAFHALEHEGLLKALERGGYVVRPIEKKEVEEICEIRAALEGLALRWAMERNGQRLIRELRKNIQRCEERLREGDVKAFVELDARFHETIARFSGSERLLELAGSLRRHMLRYRIESIYVEVNVKRAIEGHKAIVNALNEGPLEEVLAALRRHLEQSKEDILKYAFSEDRPL